jgi:hypothetical protein
MACAESIGGLVPLADLAILEEQHTALDRDSEPYAAPVGEGPASIPVSECRPEDFFDGPIVLKPDQVAGT